MPSPPYVIVPFFTLGGLDLVTQDPQLSPFRARVSKNLIKSPGNAGYRRPGNKVNADNGGNNGSFGTACFVSIDPTSGAQTCEVVVVGSKLFRRAEFKVTVTYSGTDAATVSNLVVPDATDPSSGTWFFTLAVDGVEVLSQDLGVGYDEASPVSVATLLTAINALTDFSATTTLVSSLASTSVSTANAEPAAFLASTETTQIAPSGGTVDITFFVTEEVNHPTGATAPFAGLFAKRNTDEYENASHVSANGVLLFGTKFDEMSKYDGVDCYRAGMPTATAPSTAEAGSGSLANGTYQHLVVCKQKDAVGNVITGIQSATDSVTTSGGNGINVTLTNIAASSGFNTDGAIVAGGQATVTTITVDDGAGGDHTMKVGQTAYFYDGVSGGYVEREITAITASSITISGAAVTVSDNAVISNNLRLMVYRTEASGTIFRLVEEVPNDSFNSTQVYLDEVADASLGVSYQDPALNGWDHGLPPKGGYLTVFNGRPVVSGNPANPRYFWWASPDGPEYFPSEFNHYVEGGANSAITAILATDRNLWLHQETESFLLTGDLFSKQFSIQRKGDAVGCVAHAAQVRTDDGAIWVGKNNIYGSVGGSVPVPLGNDITPVFSENLSLPDMSKLKFKRATAFYNRFYDIVIFYFPAEETTGSALHPNENSRTFTLHLKPQVPEWHEWTGLNMAGGAVSVGEDVVWSSRVYSTFDGGMQYKLYQQLRHGTIYDYVDHSVEIPWEYTPGWVHANQPSVNKKFTHIKIYTSDPIRLPQFTMITTTEHDFLADVPVTQLTTVFGDGGVGGWGAGPWGSQPWGSSALNSNKPRRLKNRLAGSLRPTFRSSGIYSEIVLAGYELQISSNTKISMKDVAEQ